MKIIIDVMSGDNAPLELLRGAVMAREEYGEDIVVVGDEAIIRRVAEENQFNLSDITVIHAPSVINMEDRALSVVREKNDSSMSVGLHLLAAGEGDAFVSAGNTGALLAGATLIVRRIRGIQRAGIATILPFETPCLLLDSGANLELEATHYEQFAYMGSKFMERVMHIDTPRVGLLNNGIEATKGSEILQDAYRHLNDSEVHFVGNIEGKDIPFGKCDVLVTDGFTGNVILKYTESIGKIMMQTIREFVSSGKEDGKSKRDLGGMKKRFDASEYGGAPLLGIAKPVIKAHGSSDAVAIKNAVRQAIAFSKNGVTRDIAVYALDFDMRLREREKRRIEMERMQEKEKRRSARAMKKQQEKNVENSADTE